MCIDTYIYFLFSFSVNYEDVIHFIFSHFLSRLLKKRKSLSESMHNMNVFKALGEFKDISVQRLIFMFKIWFVNTYVLGF